MIITLYDIAKAKTKLPDPNKFSAMDCKIAIQKIDSLDPLRLLDDKNFDFGAQVLTCELIFSKEMYQTSIGIQWLWTYTGKITITDNS